MLPVRSPHVPVLMVLIAMFVAAPASASPLYTIDSVAMATNTTLLVAVSPGDSQQKAPTPGTVGGTTERSDQRDCQKWRG
jgi:hypothetical protein